MDDRMRIGDAERDRVTARLRDHFAEGRLSQEELDDRVGATFGAKTFGDLRGILADLPEPAAAQGSRDEPPWRHTGPPWSHLRARRGFARPPWAQRRRGPRVLPMILLTLLLVLVAPGTGWLFFVFLKALLVLWLVLTVFGLIMAGRVHNRMRREWRRRYGHRRRYN